MQYHNCQGTTFPNQPLRFEPLTTDLNVGWPGMMTDITMYSDFKKLFKRATLKTFRERFLPSIDDLDINGDILDEIATIFDNVSRGVSEETSV